MAILSKVDKPNKFQSHNSLKLTLNNIQSCCTIFAGCVSFPESNSPDILALRESNLLDLIDSRIVLDEKGFCCSYAWSCSYEGHLLYGFYT